MQSPNHVNDLIALVNIHDGFGEMADDENDNDPSEQGCHPLVPPVNNVFLTPLFIGVLRSSGPSW